MTYTCLERVIQKIKSLPDEETLDWRYFICLMAISIISVFSTRPRPFFIYSAGISRDRSAKQLFIRSRRRFSIIRCDIGSYSITRNIIKSLLFVYILYNVITKRFAYGEIGILFHTKIIVLCDLNMTAIWIDYDHVFDITSNVLITSSCIRTPRDEQTSWSGAITLSRSCSFVSRIGSYYLLTIGFSVQCDRDRLLKKKLITVVETIYLINVQYLL